MPIKGYTQMLGNFDCTWWPNLKNWVLPQPCIVKRASHEDNCLVGTQSPFLHPLDRYKKEKKTQAWKDQWTSGKNTNSGTWT